MFLFWVWGRANKVLEVYPDEGIRCDNCNSENLTYFVNQNYLHLFWIPVVPNLKFVGSYCPDCFASHEVVHSETSIRLEKQTRTPIYMYSILLLIATLVLYLIFNSLNSKMEQKAYLANPIKGDVYSYKFKDDQNQDAYSFIKVVEVSNDSICVLPANMYYMKRVSYKQSDVAFVKDTVRMSRDYMKKMYERELVVEIYR